MSEMQIEDRLIACWQELLASPAVNLDDDFFDLGGDSVIAARLFATIRRMFGVNLVLSTLFEARTIRQLANVVRSAQSRDADLQSGAVVRLKEKPSAQPLFVISGLGGNVLNLRDLALHLGDSHTVYALQPKGLDGREPFQTRIEDIAEYYVREMKRIQPNGPYFLAGYSFGGLIAFEIAQQLVSAGEQVQFLGLLDSAEYQYLVRVKNGLSRRERLSLYKSRFHSALFGSDRRDYLAKRLKARLYALVRRVLDATGLHMLLHWATISDINSYAASLYRPRTYPGSVTIFRTSEREILDGNDKFLGWGSLVRGPIAVHDVPGNHFTMTREPNASVLASQLSQALEIARADADPSAFPNENTLAVPI